MFSSSARQIASCFQAKGCDFVTVWLLELFFRLRILATSG